MKRRIRRFGHGRSVADDPDFAPTAALLVDPARAAMLVALLDGRALPAGELAFLAGVSPQTASAHLARLVEGRLLARETHGRHRDFRLAGAEVAHAVEALAAVAPVREARRVVLDERARELRFARTCDDHLAGRVGVAVHEALLGVGLVVPCGAHHAVTDDGRAWFAALGVDAAALDARAGRRPLARPCLDWSERRHHLVGALGAALARRLLELEWLARIPGGRALRVTHEGERELAARLGLREAIRVSGPVVQAKVGRAPHTNRRRGRSTPAVTSRAFQGSWREIQVVEHLWKPVPAQEFSYISNVLLGGRVRQDDRYVMVHIAEIASCEGGEEGGDASKRHLAFVGEQRDRRVMVPARDAVGKGQAKPIETGLQFVRNTPLVSPHVGTTTVRNRVSPLVLKGVDSRQALTR